MIKKMGCLKLLFSTTLCSFSRFPYGIYPGVLKNRRRYCSSSGCGMKVTICGAGGCTGQPLALLLKQCPDIDELALYDQNYTCGFGIELSHVDTMCKISSYSGKHMLCDALKDSRVVVIVARNRVDTFEDNAPLLAEIALQICNACPACFTIIGTQPVESMTPLVGEIQRLRGTYNPRALLGSIELNCIRANTILADYLRVPPETIRIPVIGGATTATMVPVLSSAVHPGILTQEQVECITSCIMSGGEVVGAAKGCTTATSCLAGAFAIARNTINVVKGLKGKKVVQCAYVDSLNRCAPDCQFFVTDVVLGPSGIEKVLGVPEVTKFENCLLLNSLPYIRNEIARAVWLVYTMCLKSPRPSPSCFIPPSIPCAPPTNWTGAWPDSVRDEYLASICKEMTCTCGGTELEWVPRETEYDAARAANLTHQILTKGAPCTNCTAPLSIQIEQQIRERALNPFLNPCACEKKH